MNYSLKKYLTAFKKLRVDRSHGVAPHKPILLISVIQMFQSGLIKEGKIYLTLEIVALFKSNWSLLVSTKHDCRISYPFFYMKSEGFWTLRPKAGFTNLEKMGSIVKSFANLNAAVDHVELDKELVELLVDPDSNQILLQFLLDEYFPDTKTNFSSGGGSYKLDELERNFLKEPPSEYQLRTKQLIDQKEDEEVFLRGSIFKREIPRIYNNRCSISGLRVESIYNISMIDACHIIPFCDSYDDTVTNGIALCPNLHRAFDRGLISIDPDYKVIVSDQFIEGGDYKIRQYSGVKIHLPSSQKYWPKQENLEWHRNKVLK